MTDVRERVRYRPASEDDLVGVIDVFLSCWRRSYVRVLPPPLVTAMTEQRARELWTPLAPTRSGGALVAVSDGEVVGITRWTLDEPGSAGLIGSLYVHPDAQGAGIGAGLLERAVVDIAASGAERATLWVFEPNDAARGFYALHGFHPDGTTRVEEEFGVPELRLVRGLGAR